MFAKLFNKNPQQASPPEDDDPKLKDFEPRVIVHYGIPSTASILAFDPLQHLLAIGTLDGRIKVLGGDNIECLLISPNPVPYKNLEFLQNQGFLVSVSNENIIQVWDLEKRLLAAFLQWGSNISAFSVVCGTNYMYVGDEYGYLSVLKYDFEEGNIQPMPYQIPPDLIADGSGIQIPEHQSVVGLLAQPCSSGKRVLIAYQNGLMIIWDVSEDKSILIRAHKDLQLKDDIIIRSTGEMKHENINNKSDDEQQSEKEISALCWASSDGSILAVGYVDGDIILWNLSTNNQKTNKNTKNAIKLRFSSSDKRLPVIVLHWCLNSQNNGSGQLFVYGGDDIGSEEVLTILNLDLSSGIEGLKFVKRVDLTLNGSYADIEVVPNIGVTESSYTSLFVLTNPGQLHVYDDESLTGLTSAVKPVQCPVTLPTVEPYMTVSKLCLVPKDGDLQRVLSETVLAVKSELTSSPKTPGSGKWPVSGGFLSQLENIGVERIYIAGYQDGSVKIWDATFPVFSLIFTLELQVEDEDTEEDTEIPGASEPISAMDFNSKTASLAVGNNCGLVHLLKLVGETEEKNVPLVTETKRQEINLDHGNGWQSTAVFSVLTSRVQTLQYTFSGARVIVGYECGKAAVLDVQSSSVLYLTDILVNPSSPIVSMTLKRYLQSDTNDNEQFGNTSTSDSETEVAFLLTKDSHIIFLDSNNGNKICSSSVNPKESTAISLYILDESFPVPELPEENPTNSSQETTNEKDSSKSTEPESESTEAEESTSSQPTELWKNFVDSLILICCEDSLLLHSTKSLIQGKQNFICKIDLEKRCCWTTIFKKNEEESGVVLVYSTGIIEIRSLPDLKVVAETSLMSVLRWNFKTKMENTMSSFGNGHISMVYGCEFAVVSLFSSENDFRIPEALPRLHDKVVAEAAEAAYKFALSQKKQTAPTGILGGIIKNIKRDKGNETETIEETRDVLVPKLEALFSRTPFSVSDLDLDLDLGDDDNFDMPTKLVVERIEVEPKNPSPPSPAPIPSPDKNKKTERDRLLEGGSEPKVRTTDEIKAKYRKSDAAGAAAAALEAKDKLLERQQKLEKLKENAEELESGSENFASMAEQLAKQMENRKWWQL